MKLYLYFNYKQSELIVKISTTLKLIKKACLVSDFSWCYYTRCGLWTIHRSLLFTAFNNSSDSEVYLFHLYINLNIYWLVFEFRAMTSVLGNIPGTDIYESIEICDEVTF